MQIKANDLHPGNVIELRDKLWMTVKTQHVKPGKGGAFIQAKLKNVIDGTKLSERFRSVEMIERVRLDQREYQFLYQQGEQLVLMDTQSYEQLEIDKQLLGDRVALLQDAMQIKIESYQDKVIDIALPEHIVLEIDSTEPVVKGQTSAASYKPALLVNGLRVMVPPFVMSGDKIIIESAGLTYVRRAD